MSAGLLLEAPGCTISYRRQSSANHVSAIFNACFSCFCAPGPTRETPSGRYCFRGVRRSSSTLFWLIARWRRLSWSFLASPSLSLPSYSLPSPSLSVVFLVQRVSLSIGGRLFACLKKASGGEFMHVRG
eukprot:8808414-Pyramimonas_sp.AAC.1